MSVVPHVCSVQNIKISSYVSDRCADQISWVWVYFVLWKGWNLLQQRLGNSLWWWLGLKWCTGGVQGVGLWFSTECRSRGPIWSRNWTNLAWWCGLFRKWKISKWVSARRIWDTQLWTWWGRWCRLFRWEVQHFKEHNWSLLQELVLWFCLTCLLPSLSWDRLQLPNSLLKVLCWTNSSIWLLKDKWAKYCEQPSFPCKMFYFCGFGKSDSYLVKLSCTWMWLSCSCMWC